MYTFIHPYINTDRHIDRQTDTYTNVHVRTLANTPQLSNGTNSRTFDISEYTLCEYLGVYGGAWKNPSRFTPTVHIHMYVYIYIYICI
jgi:hypothetical protein